MAKTISGSVGRGGFNRPGDVVIVQYLLNCVPPGEGGPQEELALDGICGPKTNAAILRLQKKIAGSGLGWLDVGGPTFKQLSGFDPYPDYKLNLSGSKSSGKHGSDHIHKVKTGAPSSSVKDPWGYYDPSGSKHQVKGFAPPAKFGGKHAEETGVKLGWKEAWKEASKQGWKQGGKDSDASAGKGFGEKHGWKEAWKLAGKESGEKQGWKEAWKLGGKESAEKQGWKEAWKLGGKDSNASAGKGFHGKQDRGDSGWKLGSRVSGKNEFGFD